ncbi:phd and ring finger domain-containing protein 1 [Holotrichia oblita]|uniref:Phd and ring finger domain-containing protein 1 n=1 Tax=Holotrichia oblita TaxID=644536 RepID=A0ACB9SVP3_HOLOL|nr:phd and ring finger domain-containing protein 1 [Holotrichia oblita]
MSDESDVGSSRDRRKRKALYIEESSSDSDSSIETTRRKRRKHKVYIRESDSESDSSIEVVHKKRIGRVTSDAEGSTSGSDIVRRKRQVATLASDSNVSDSSDSEFDSDWVTETEAKTTSTQDTKLVSKNDSSSDSGDDQLEKCPICLLPFKSQEVGSPESCDHSFCIDCILEWSKNVNTCPVDRQIFNLILVRSHYNGKIINQIPIEPAQQQNGINEIQEDPTFCEICGSCEREDRMLLCDGCDLGFHLECLTPPLSDVPAGLWFCPECGPGDEDDVVDVYEVQILLEDAHTLGWPSGPRARNTTRLVPRTRQSERVRARVITHRNQRQRNENELPQQQARNGSQPGPSSSTDRNRSNHGARNRSRRPKIRIRYEIDQITGERIAIETKIRRRKRKNRRQRERARMAAQAAKSVKGRLAAQLGIYPNNRQGLVETSRASDSTNSIGYQRSQAGIPALHLFGPREELDYYGGTESEEDISSANLLIRRRPQASDVALFRRAARRKAIVAPIAHQPESTNLLDSILDIQSKFHSKNSVMSLNQDGSVKIDSKDISTIINNNNNDKSKNKNSSENRRINLNDYTNAYFRQTPMYGNGPPASPSVYNNADFSRRSAVDSVTWFYLGGRDEDGQNYSLHQVCSSYDYESDKKEKDKDKSRSNTPGTPNSDSELDIYSDIETVSTSRAEEYDPKQPTSLQRDVDLVIDTEKADDSKEQVSSTVDLADPIPVPHPTQTAHTSAEAQKRDLEIQNQTVQSTNSKIGNEKDDKDDEEDDSEDGCPNFSIYSSESINIAKTTDLQLISDKNNAPAQNTTAGDLNSQSNDVNVAVGDIDKISVLPTTINDNSIYNNEPLEDQIDNTQSFSYSKPGNMQCGLYSDSEDESIVKITKIPIPCEDKAEEEPELLAICEANEKDVVNGTDATVKTKKPFALGDIRNMTEDISEEERSYTPCLDERTHKQGLEGLDTEMISDDDRNDFDESHELKTASEGDALEINAKESELDFSKPEDYEEGEIVDKLKNKKPLGEQKNPPQEPEKEPEKEEIETTENKEAEPTPASFKKLSKSNKERNYRDKEKDKENVRSKSKEKKSDKENKRKKKGEKERLGALQCSFHDRRETQTRQRQIRSRPASASPTRRRREWLGRSKDWSRSLSRSYTPEKRLTPSWTPPRLLEPQPVKPPNLTVILNNDHNKKKKEKRKNKKGKEADKAKKRKRYRTPPPSKEVFASGNNILVSVSFNKDRNQRDVTNKRKRDLLDDSVTRKQRKTKEKRKNDPKRKKKKKDLSGVKPVAIIDLDRSPFREVTPSPEDVIVLTDSENAESNDMLGLQKAICDSSQQVASPERPMNTNYLTGPKTPPEPQVKFTLNPKQTQMRAISNPLHEPDDIEEEIDPQEELEQRLNESLHKGPNTPPEPPNSPPSSPDVYDPFEPTKSRSPTPEPLPPAVQLSSTSQNDSVREESLIDSRNDDDETIDQSHTPPAITDIQPADSQCSNMKPLSPEKSPEQHIGVVINRVVQSQAAIFPTVASKTITSFSNASIVTSTPMVPPRINILSSTVLTPTTIASALPQRIVLPNTTKSSPVKVSPNKLPIKSTPIKPMPAKNLMNKSNKSSRKSNNHAGNENYDALLDFESPYSPGSSDYEDLFEPPPVEANAPNKNTSNNNKQSASQKPQKDSTAFDILFGTSPVNNCFTKTKTKSKGGNNANKYKKNAKGTKQVGVKIDEDTLKILDELPNSAVEMQVKYKYLKKLNRQERVVEEVKLVLKPHYNKKHINKEEYKDILRRAVPKICHNKSGEINPQKIQNLIEAYVKKIRHSKKVTSSSSVNPQKA